MHPHSASSGVTCYLSLKRHSANYSRIFCQGLAFASNVQWRFLNRRIYSLSTRITWKVLFMSLLSLLRRLWPTYLRQGPDICLNKFPRWHRHSGRFQSPEIKLQVVLLKFLRDPQMAPKLHWPSLRRWLDELLLITSQRALQPSCCDLFGSQVWQSRADMIPCHPPPKFSKVTLMECFSSHLTVHLIL